MFIQQSLVKLFLAFIMILLFAESNKSYGRTEGMMILIELEGTQDSLIYLAGYYGNQTYLIDTAFAEGHSFQFHSDTLLPQGIYIIAGQHNNRLFEIILDEDQQFEIWTSQSDILGQMKLKGSETNQTFIDHILLTQEVYLTIDSLKKQNAESAEHLIEGWNNKLTTFKSNYIQQHPDSFLSMVFNAMKEPDNPEETKTVAYYHYYVQHFFDNIDLSDPRVLRTPLYSKKLEEYLSSIVYPQVDSINKAIDFLINRSSQNDETYRFMVYFLTMRYEHSKVMGHDAVYAYLIKQYYLKGKTPWVSKATIQALEIRLKNLQRTLIGQVAPELIMMDSAGVFHSLHHVDAPYTLLLFFDPECGHCKGEIHAIYDWYLEGNTNLEVFAVCSSDVPRDTWIHFLDKENLPWINVYSRESITADYHQLYNIQKTPELFLLDSQKKIIAKQISAEAMRLFLERYIKSI